MSKSFLDPLMFSAPGWSLCVARCLQRLKHRFSNKWRLESVFSTLQFQFLNGYLTVMTWKCFSSMVVSLNLHKISIEYSKQSANLHYSSLPEATLQFRVIIHQLVAVVLLWSLASSSVNAFLFLVLLLTTY